MIIDNYNDHGHNDIDGLDHGCHDHDCNPDDYYDNRLNLKYCKTPPPVHSILPMTYYSTIRYADWSSH